jgi:hypothetical protein
MAKIIELQKLGISPSSVNHKLTQLNDLIEQKTLKQLQDALRRKSIRLVEERGKLILKIGVIPAFELIVKYDKKTRKYIVSIEEI